MVLRDACPPAVLERLAERLHCVASELGQLVEEQDAVMRECSGMSLDVRTSPAGVRTSARMSGDQKR